MKSSTNTYMQMIAIDHGLLVFSGGKRLNCFCLQLVWEAISRVKENGRFWRDLSMLFCNDTMVEKPDYYKTMSRKYLEKLSKQHEDQDIPIFVEKTTPRLEDSFLGKTL